MATYQLTLTADERTAIDWIGHRYAHGDDLYKALCRCEWKPESVEAWNDPVPITFEIPEYVAWEISELIDQDNLACFSDEFRYKLLDFQGKIV